jgi:hypothetical protein
LSDADLRALTTWAFRRQEKERERKAIREELSAKAALSASEKEKNLHLCEILLVAREGDIELTLLNLLGEDRLFYRVSPTTAHLKEGLSNKPHLVIFHAASGHEAERLLLKSLSEIVPWGVPTILLGTDIDNETLTELGLACKTVSSIPWAPSKALFLQRLVLGILRNYYGHSENPVAAY